MPGPTKKERDTAYRARIALEPKVIPEVKHCRICKMTKPADEFYNMSASRDGLQSYCIPCNKIRRNGSHIASHGITVERFDQMVLEQGGKCAICARPPVRQGNVTWTIDHDHNCCPGEKSCGACVRGLLCNSCNRALGMFGDDAETLMAAAAYLITSKEA